ncbi:MAG: hypothetical protein ACSHYF_00105 [Verrucomicrobiaceae bacterium]
MSGVLVWESVKKVVEVRLNRGAGVKGGACDSRDPSGRCVLAMGDPMAEAMGFVVMSFPLFGMPTAMLGGRGGFVGGFAIIGHEGAAAALKGWMLTVGIEDL